MIFGDVITKIRCYLCANDECKMVKCEKCKKIICRDCKDTVFTSGGKTCFWCKSKNMKK